MDHWISWVLLGAGLVAVFVLWDLVFCGGQRCHGMLDRTPIGPMFGPWLRLRRSDRRPKGPTQ